ncbi:MAG: sensor histidine kinase [Pirellulaceae bacterium]|nr:sensor histidine kinase [Pirellulaceae bacterium]
MLSFSPAGIMRWPPWTIGLVVVGIVLTTEYIVMLIIPRVLPEGTPDWLDALVDSVLLSLIVSPVMWWAIVGPLKNLNQVRERFIAAVLTSQEEDRRLIARELHDSTGQSLTLLVTSLRSWPPPISDEQRQRLSDLSQIAQQTLKEIKDLTQLIRPSLLDDLGLAAAMERVTTTVQRHHPIVVHFDAKQMEGRRLDGNVETALFRIFQEAVNNAVKHSGASDLWIELSLTIGRVTLEIIDNGRGISRSASSSSTFTGMGIVGMQERANQLGGKLTIVTGKQGTRVSVSFSVEAGQ